MSGVPAQITLYDSLTGCTGEVTICVDVIKKPDADFAVLPSLSPASGIINVCLGSTVAFHDLSTADPTSPIVSWLWNFGDGTGSSQENPSHVFNTAGHFTVYLVVKNACNCSDTAKVTINVNSYPAPEITCPAVVCQNSTAVYNAATGCGTYQWSVIGGTIVSGEGTPSINVLWNDVNPITGFGYVNVVNVCGGSVCPDTSSMQVPVILSHPEIQGPNKICAGQQYEYTLPLSPATEYQWGLLGNPNGIIGVRNDHSVVIAVDSAGEYTLHGWFQNPITLCGGNVYKHIKVLAPATITGDLTPCDANPTYTINGGDGGNYHWTLAGSGPTYTNQEGYGSGTTFTPTFPSPGAYTLTIDGNYCTTPIIIHVQPSPGVINNLSGPDTVCLNREYTYSASADSPGSVYNWEITGGTITPATGSIVTAVWNSSGPKYITVYRTNINAPYCNGSATSIVVTQELIDPTITGDTLPCANSYRTYTANYTRGESYVWTISPNTAGSVVGGNHGPNVNVLWNNTTIETGVDLTVVINKCDSTFTKTLHINLQAGSTPILTGPSLPVCPGDSVEFTATSGGTSYLWNFGDGSQQVTTSYDSIFHAFPVNTTSSDISYAVTVTVTPDTSEHCPLLGTATTQVAIKPGPVAYATTSAPNTSVDSSNLVGTVTNNVSALTYQWYLDSSIISGATNSTYLTIDTGNYYFVVTAGNGCSAISNLVYPRAIGGPSDSCQITISVATNIGCDEVYLINGYAEGLWIPNTPPIGGLINYGAYDLAKYASPGVYSFHYRLPGFDSCSYIANVFDTIGFIPSFNYIINCASVAGMDSITLIDHTAHLTFYTIDSVQWTETDGTVLGTGNNFTFAWPAGSSITVIQRVYCSGPDSQKVCDATQSITTPGLLSAAFTDSIGSICEGVPVFFTPTNTTNVVSYNWDFGDQSSSLLQAPQRTYTWSAALGFSGPNPDTVTLTVTDVIGCSTSATHSRW